MEHQKLGTVRSGLIMYPLGHARNKSTELEAVLAHKFKLLAQLGVESPERFRNRFSGFRDKNANDIQQLYDFQLRVHEQPNSVIS